MFLKVIFNLIVTYNICLYAGDKITDNYETDAQKIASIRATVVSNPTSTSAEQSYWDELVEENLQIAEGTRAAPETFSKEQTSSEGQESIQKKALENAKNNSDFFQRAKELFAELQITEFKVRPSV